MDVLEKVSRAIANDYGITLTFSGTQAYTDCKHINLPMLPQEMLSDESVDMLRGYCDHEIAHVLFSSATLITEPHFLNSPPEVTLLTGVIEDIRVEREMSKKYSGARVNMQRLTQMLLPKTDVKHPVGALLVEGRRQILDYKLEVDDLTEKLKKAFNEDKLFEKIAATNSSEDSFELAKELIKNIPPQQKSPSPPTPDTPTPDTPTPDTPTPDNNESDLEIDGDSDNSNEEKDGEEKDDEDGEEKDDEDGEAEIQVDGEKENKGKGRGKGGESDENNSDKGGSSDNAQLSQGNENANGVVAAGDNSFCLMSENFDAPMKQAFEELCKDANRYLGSSYVPLSTSYDEMIVVRPYNPATAHNGFKKDYIYEKMKESYPKLNAFKAKVVSQFNTRVAGNWMLGKDKGKINNRALSGAMTGRKDVFKERYVCDDVNTAITLLIDFSGSMSCCGKIETAMKTVVMFCEILKDTKIKFEILGFTSGMPLRSFNPKMTEGIKDGFARDDKLITFVFKTFEEPMGATVKNRISNWQTLDKRNNYDGENLKIAFKRIMRRKEKRKIMFVLSDGKPCPFIHRDGRDGGAYLYKIAREIQDKSPVELIGIGYLNVAVKNYYDNNIIIDKVHELPQIMQEQLCKILKVSGNSR